MTWVGKGDKQPSAPYAGTVELLRSGAVPADFWDWREGADFTFGRRRSAPQPTAAGTSPGAAAATDADEEELSDAPSDDDMALAAGAASTQSGGASRGARAGGFGAVPVATHAAAFGSGQAAATVSAAAEASAAAGPGAADTDGPSTPRVVGVHLRSPFSLAAADDLRTEFTNYVSHPLPIELPLPGACPVQACVCPEMHVDLLRGGAPHCC